MTLAIVLSALNSPRWPPLARYTHNLSRPDPPQEELWYYQYPALGNIVPVYALMLLSFLLPLLVIVLVELRKVSNSPMRQRRTCSAA